MDISSRPQDPQSVSNEDSENADGVPQGRPDIRAGEGYPRTITEHYERFTSHPQWNPNFRPSKMRSFYELRYAEE
jgi:hypothetical protein